MRIPTRKTIASLAALAAVSSLVACSSDGSGDGYQIGVMTDLSGPYSRQSQTWIAGLRSSIDQTNKAGGVNGRQIELIERDNASDLQRAITNFRELDSADVIANFGNNLSNIIAAVAPQAESTKIPTVTLTDVPAVMTPEPPSYVFSDEVPTPTWAALQLDYAAKLFKDRGITNPKIAVYTIETASAEPYRAAIVEGANERGWTVVASESAEQTATDVTTQARSIASAKPDAVVTYVVNIVQAITAFQAQGLPRPVPVISQKQSGDVSNFEAIAKMGQDFSAMRSFTMPYETDVPAVKAMRDAIEAAGQWKDELETSEYTTQGYVDGLLIKNALTVCGEECDRDGFRNALQDTTALDTDGLSGAFGQDGNHRFVAEGKVYRWDPSKNLPLPLDDTWLNAE
ncbi:ABC transporter substrate-binding protein [Rhodococcoides yunnanense]|uniref:ABC transporter substrate-binding protein n=1 Tax=Rhodococcoides yunnanense TaxID=278209 RepID=UPI000A038D45|nr:ABC transporter substrate-binding protein [Rhodococcus yunnanensis]